MTSRIPKLTDDEIEAEVLADLDDPSAWEEPIYVPPRPKVERRPLRPPDVDSSEAEAASDPL
jgi:hypothetical protein